MEDYKEFSREQYGAIARSIELGRTLQKEHPEIAVIYGYYSQVDISNMLDIQSKYGVSDDVAWTGVRYAINGHEGSFRIEGYVGLITDEKELKRLGKGRRVAGSRKGIMARGLTPWSDEEKEFAYMLSQEQEYQLPKGSSNPGKPNNELIAVALNMEYHDCKEVRSTKAVKRQLFNYRKSLVDMVV